MRVTGWQWAPPAERQATHTTHQLAAMWVPAAGAPAPGALAGELSQLQARRAEAAHPELHDRSFALLQRCQPRKELLVRLLRPLMSM